MMRAMCNQAHEDNRGQGRQGLMGHWKGSGFYYRDRSSGRI